MKFLVLGLLVLWGILLCRQIIAQKAVEAIFTQTTDFPIRVGPVQINPWHSRFAATGIQLFNPPGFHDRMFANIPRFDVDYEAGSFLRDRPHFTRADLHIREIVIVKNTNGHSNLEQLGRLSASDLERASTRVRFQIDTLNLQLGSVTIKDYTTARPEVSKRQLNLSVTLRDVNERTDINRRIFWAMVKRAWLPGFTSATTSTQFEVVR